MAKVSFSSDIKITPQRQTFPKLSGLKKGEKVRIQLISTEDIEMDYVHSLNIPIIENGAGVLDSKGNYKTTYKGSPLSFGDMSILEDRGIDPKNCPISKMAKEHPDWVAPPRRKFAMHIIQYRTKPGSFDLATPFNVEHKVWVMTDKTFAKLKEYTTEWGDLRKHDLYITCENEQFQQFDISVAPRAAWTNDKADMKFAMDTYNAGKEAYPDLSLAIGQRKEMEWVVRDLQEIEEAWNVVSGKGAASEESLDDLLTGQNNWVSSDDSGSETTDDNILSSLADSASSSDDDSEGATDFDSLLADLKG